jgi:hypothetical protein
MCPGNKVGGNTRCMRWRKQNLPNETPPLFPPKRHPSRKEHLRVKSYTAAVYANSTIQLKTQQSGPIQSSPRLCQVCVKGASRYLSPKCKVPWECQCRKTSSKQQRHDTARKVVTQFRVELLQSRYIRRNHRRINKRQECVPESYQVLRFAETNRR